MYYTLSWKILQSARLKTSANYAARHKTNDNYENLILLSRENSYRICFMTRVCPSSWAKKLY